MRTLGPLAAAHYGGSIAPRGMCQQVSDDDAEHDFVAGPNRFRVAELFVDMPDLDLLFEDEVDPQAS